MIHLQKLKVECSFLALRIRYISPIFTIMKLENISNLPPEGIDEDALKDEFKEICKEISEYQEKLFAQSEKCILIVLQGMDASGKSSTVRDVFRYVNPMGIHVKSFKRPTDEEFAHDFLWRVHEHAPKKGMISIFDRSHYEDILIQRVHHWIDEDRVKQRMKHINNFEQLLVEENNTIILKFYLHISKKEQHEDLMERKNDPTKYWKHNDGDWKEREYWDEYMAAYEDVFKHCSPEIPWHIIPGDKSWYKKYCVAKILLQTMKGMNLSFPTKEELKIE